MTTEKTYQFYGIDAKTELRIGIIAGINALLIMAICPFIYLKFFTKQDNIPIGIFWLIILLALIWVSVIMKFLGKKYTKLWELRKLSDKLIIKYGEIIHEILLDDITKVKVLGSTNFRYLTIVYKLEAIKIRVGASSLTPFSRQGDVQKIDSFIRQELIPYLNKNFTKKDKHPFLGIYIKN